MRERDKEEFAYRNPKENLEQGGDPLHTIDLMLDGIIIGRAEMTYYSKPFPLCQVSDIYVEPQYQGAGRAEKIMEQVESFLKERRKAGVLVDAIDPDSPASGMYARRGWQEVPESGGLHVFNLPDGATLADFKGYALRQTDMMERESWKKNFGTAYNTMRERYSPGETSPSERFAQWPGIKDRIREVLRLNESGGEPFFFMIESKTGDQSTSPLFQGGALKIEAPIAVMLCYLFPDLAEEDFDRIAGGGGTEEEVRAIDAKLAEVKGMVHFQPGGVIEPSMEDLDITHHLYSLYSSVGVSPPLQVIGRRNQESKIDLLSLNQIANLPAQEIVTALPHLVEKYVLLRALPSYLERSGLADRANELRQTLAESENLQFDQFIEKFKQTLASMPDQEVIESFKTQFRADFTIFPEYLSCVKEALSEFRCFETEISTIDTEN